MTREWVWVRALGKSVSFQTREISPSSGEHVISGKRSAAFAWNGSNFVERVQDAKPKPAAQSAAGEAEKSPPVSFQIRYILIIASPSHGEVAAHESAQSERSKKNAPSVGNKLPPAPHGDGEPKRGISYLKHISEDFPGYASDTLLPHFAFKARKGFLTTNNT